MLWEINNRSLLQWDIENYPKTQKPKAGNNDYLRVKGLLWVITNGTNIQRHIKPIYQTFWFKNKIIKRNKPGNVVTTFQNGLSQNGNAVPNLVIFSLRIYFLSMWIWKERLGESDLFSVLWWMGYSSVFTPQWNPFNSCHRESIVKTINQRGQSRPSHDLAFVNLSVPRGWSGRKDHLPGPQPFTCSYI